MGLPAAYIKVRLDAVRHNYDLLRQLAHPAAVMPVLKGNAYGHGLVEIVRCLAAAGATWLGIATVDEGRILRNAGIRTPLFLLYGPQPEESAEVLDLGLVCAVWHEEQVHALEQAARQQGVVTLLHVLVEVSRNWLGVRENDLARFCSLLARSPNLVVEGVCAHLWNVDQFPSQLERFNRAVAEVQSYFPAATTLHIANTTALRQDRRSHLSMVRPGIALFGVGEDRLEQAMAIYARLQAVVEVPAGYRFGYGERIAEQASSLGIIATGYSQGLDPRITSGGRVLLDGEYCPVLSVGMGMTTVDLTHLQVHPAPGAMACLLGTQGSNSITVQEVAGILQCSPYEIFTRFCAALPRLYE